MLLSTQSYIIFSKHTNTFNIFYLFEVKSKQGDEETRKRVNKVKSKQVNEVRSKQVNEVKQT
jgi:hypothetical protein